MNFNFTNIGTTSMVFRDSSERIFQNGSDKRFQWQTLWSDNFFVETKIIEFIKI